MQFLPSLPTSTSDGSEGFQVRFSDVIVNLQNFKICQVFD